MEKEFYKRNLPHYNSPDQNYFVTFILKSSVPPSVLKENKIKLEMARNQFDHAVKLNKTDEELSELKDKIYQLKKAQAKQIEKILHNNRHPEVDLRKTNNLDKIIESLHFWENNRVENIAWSVMPNHVHWVFHLKEKDPLNQLTNLGKLMQSVKRFTANSINKNEGRKGSLWLDESFDTTIRNEYHLHNVINYTLHNPVKAGLVRNWKDWKGNFVSEKYQDEVDDGFGKTTD
ncbi:MAG: transposase [Prolixibacteraceae bacterium]|nr:transposase [Prolixibacteraceae bacterium]